MDQLGAMRAFVRVVQTGSFSAAAREANASQATISKRVAALEAQLGESESTRLAWRTTTTTEMDLEGMQKLMKLVDALEDDDDVQRVTANFEVSDEVMEQLSA